MNWVIPLLNYILKPITIRKKMKLIYLFLTFSLLIYAQEETVKRKLRSNSTLKELIIPYEVESFNQMFTEGVLYGRLRFNSFLFDWDTEVENKRKDHYTMGIGGSIIYKSAYFKGFGFTVGGYTSQNPWHMDDEDVKYYKVGKGVLKRYDVATKGEYGISSLAQAYLEYKSEGLSLKIGRQIFESRMTKSNDIKMIPNTFEGVTLHSKVIPKHNLKVAYLDKQKLRDHTDFHHIFAYDDGEGEYDKWRENDDTAMHRGITLSKLEALGIEDRVLLFELDSSEKKDFTYLLNYTLVPELFSSVTADMSYTYFMQEFKISPALRYMHQFDHGAGSIGGANLKTNNIAYSNPDSVEADLYGVRVDVSKDNWRIRTGISKVADKADIISPWRAFATDGFGYSLLQYNWYSNTTSYLIQGDYDFHKYDLHAQIRFAIQDFDDDKPGVQADSNVLQFDFIKQFKSIPNLYGKLRMVRVKGDDNTIAQDGTQKLNPSYTDIRFELNYLF